VPDTLERRLHYAANDSDNFLDAAQNARLIASAERYYRVMYFGARNLGSAAYPYVRHARPHPGFQPLLIFPAAFCWDPEAQADLRCGFAAAFLAGASLDFLPYRISTGFYCDGWCFRHFHPDSSSGATGAGRTDPGEKQDRKPDQLDEGMACAGEFQQVGNPLPDGDALERARSSLSNIFERQPLVLGAIGLAIGAAVAGAFETSEIENEWVGELSDTVKEVLSTRSEAVAQRMREGVDTLRSEISDAGAESIDRLKQTGREARRRS
jgi:hypothetical protein